MICFNRLWENYAAANWLCKLIREFVSNLNSPGKANTAVNHLDTIHEALWDTQPVSMSTMVQMCAHEGHADESHTLKLVLESH